MATMNWKKLGLIFDPNMLKDKGKSAALMPIPEVLDYDKGIMRVYFAPRDTENRSEIHFFDVSIHNPFEILRISHSPLLSHGKLGTFDDSGITPGNIVTVDGVKRLYYTGWNLLINVPMNNSIGVAKFVNPESIERYGDGPVMTRTLTEPYSCASPHVMCEDGVYRMWYASMDKWLLENNTPKHYYNIKYAESDDGLNWKRQNHIAINYESDGEYAFGRPWVLKEQGIYKMWYSYRGDRYLIGYAESHNGLDWTRLDEKAGISPSEKGWDSEMIEYPSIVDLADGRYMLYNGNGYGKSGIGLAKLQEEGK